MRCAATSKIWPSPIWSLRRTPSCKRWFLSAARSLKNSLPNFRRRFTSTWPRMASAPISRDASNACTQFIKKFSAKKGVWNKFTICWLSASSPIRCATAMPLSGWSIRFGGRCQDDSRIISRCPARTSTSRYIRRSFMEDSRLKCKYAPVRCTASRSKAWPRTGGTRMARMLRKTINAWCGCDS